MKICMIGLGYIGLPTACILAYKGSNTVFGYDINKNYIERLQKLNINTDEPGLLEMIIEVISNKKLILNDKLEECDVYLIAVPTPFKEDKTCDTKYINSAAISIASLLKKGDLVILESTVSPGTTEDILTSILEKNTNLIAGKDFFVAYSAERVIPGNIIYELENNDRIIGGINKKSGDKAREIYKIFVEGDIFLTDCKTAEVTKLMENTFRDVNIGIANEFAKIAEKMGFDIWEAIKLANRHPRVNILNPGPGVGGHCIAVDPWFFVGMAPKESKLIEMARIINDDMPIYVTKRVGEIWPNENKIGVLGVTYKANIADTRKSPSSILIKELIDKNYEVFVSDPYAEAYEFPIIGLSEVIDQSDILIIMVDHHQYKGERIIKVIKDKNKKVKIFDTKNTIKGYEGNTMIEVKRIGE